MIKNDKDVIVLKNYIIKVSQIRWIKFSKFFKCIKLRLMNNDLICVSFKCKHDYVRAYYEIADAFFLRLPRNDFI